MMDKGKSSKKVPKEIPVRKQPQKKKPKKAKIAKSAKKAKTHKPAKKAGKAPKKSRKAKTAKNSKKSTKKRSATTSAQDRVMKKGPKKHLPAKKGKRKIVKK